MYEGGRESAGRWVWWSGILHKEENKKKKRANWGSEYNAIDLNCFCLDDDYVLFALSPLMNVWFCCWLVGWLVYGYEMKKTGAVQLGPSDLLRLSSSSVFLLASSSSSLLS